MNRFFFKITQLAPQAMILLFSFALLLPTLDSLFKLDHAPMSNENHPPAKFPVYCGLSHLKDFISGLEAYFNDHFGFRKRLIRTNNHWKHELFREGRGEVTYGKDGWLFFTGERMIENYSGTAQFSQQDLADWQKLLEMRRDWLAKRGCKYVFVACPDKQTIYPESLPDWLVRGTNKTKLDQFVEHLKNNTTITVLDLRPCLLEAKKKEFVYLATDTHWNLLGNFIGYQTLMEKLSEYFPDLHPLPREAFEIKPTTEPGGDLSMMLGDLKVPEPNQFKITPKPPLVPLVASTNYTRVSGTWDHHTVPSFTTNEKATRKAVLFRDSFAKPWIRLLGYHFNEVTYVWRYSWDPAFIEKEKPDIVIDEMLERFICTTSPRELIQKDHLDRFP